MNPVRTLRARANLTQEELAQAAGTSQPAIAAYEAGRKSPTLRTVERLATAAGLNAFVRYTAPLTREDRRSLALHRAIAERLRKDPERVLRHARRALAQMKAQAPTSLLLLREWEVLLDRPVEALLPLLTDPDEWARELRHVTPFAGVLSATDRAEIYRAFAAAERRAS